jgi:VanZ like family
MLRLASWLALAAVMILSTVPGSLRPQTGAPGYVEHFAAYLITGFLFVSAYPRHVALAVVLLAALAGIVEFVQSWIPGRTPGVADFIASALGAGAGSLLGSSLHLWVHRWPP